MFTQGQMIFAGIFAVVFIIVMIVSYTRDKKIHKKQYKGSLWILIGFLAFIAFLLLVKNLTRG
jgi:cytochrome bd-type quinol oxidase subunit 1